jgi:hypothetical protein
MGTALPIETQAAQLTGRVENENMGAFRHMKTWHIRRYSLGGLIGVRWEASYTHPYGVPPCLRIWVNLIPFCPLVIYELYVFPEYWSYCDWNPHFADPDMT